MNIVLGVRTDKEESELWLKIDDAIYKAIWLAHRELSNTIHLKISEMFDEHNIGYADLNGVIGYLGPGSFTGLRIGNSVVNATAYSIGIPVVGSSGDDWFEVGCRRLMAGENDKVIVPEYGGQIHITVQKK